MVMGFSAGSELRMSDRLYKACPLCNIELPEIVSSPLSLKIGMTSIWFPKWKYFLKGYYLQIHIFVVLNNFELKSRLPSKPSSPWH